MRTVEEIERRLAAIIEEVTLGEKPAAGLAPSMSLMGDIGLDSLDYATTMLNGEEWLGVKVREADVDWRSVRTLGDLAALLHRAQS